MSAANIRSEVRAGISMRGDAPWKRAGVVLTSAGTIHDRARPPFLPTGTATLWIVPLVRCEASHSGISVGRGSVSRVLASIMRRLCPALLSLLLIAPALANSAPEADEARVSVDFKDADVVDIIRLLSEVGGFQVVIDPGVACKLTLKLREVPWPTTLDLTLRSCGLAREEDHGVVRVATAAKLTTEAAERRKLTEEQRLNRPTQTRMYRLSYARAAELAPLIKKFLSARGEVIFDARTNTLIVTDIVD